MGRLFPSGAVALVSSAGESSEISCKNSNSVCSDGGAHIQQLLLTNAFDIFKPFPCFN
jgi:hypothetical protein